MASTEVKTYIPNNAQIGLTTSDDGQLVIVTCRVEREEADVSMILTFESEAFGKVMELADKKVKR